jgi:radical SAM protein with 4Fe4S-binding SPASM domain
MGLHSYLVAQDQGRTRVHLRVRSSGEGLLLINANRALHLNPTATWMAWMVLEGFPEETVIKYLTHEYHVDKTEVLHDFKDIQNTLAGLTQPNSACPVHDLDLNLLPPFSQTPEAPYRMDLALTYRCNSNCAHCYNARSRRTPELSTKQWSGIVDQLWDIGIPHLCFTGGEATLRPDLGELISYAQEKGQITGLLTNGRRLADRGYVEALASAGLDHVQITLESSDREIHDKMVQADGAWDQTVRGIENVLACDLYVMTNTTLLTENAPSLGSTLDFLAELGVPTIGCNALIYSGAGSRIGTGLPEKDLSPLLQIARDKTDRHGQRLIWYTPTQYCHFDPMALELGVKACTAASYNMCVEPDGSVIPCQSYYQSLGNIQNDPWDSIWNHERAVWLRERSYAPEKCQECAVFNECGGGCPLSLDHQKPIRNFNELITLQP